MESPAARTTLAERLCSDDHDLLREAQSLLAEAEQVLVEGNDDLEACAEEAGARIPREDASEIGKRIGSYVVVRTIGQGGMGTVYLAARADGYFEKEVAIKVLNRGTNMAEVLRRFHLERQVLARLDHPNIARLLDAGSTDEGLPYFVMEYVEGVPVTHFLDAMGAPISARLAIFLKVCAAVEAAHRNSIIHRDLKPSNILVNQDGEPKLLDFGIAKVIGADPGPLELTATEEQRLTPIAASPEQALGSPITKSSDIYALGSLLYEMLTGSRPYRFLTRTPSRAELAVIICEEKPASPSLVAKDKQTRRLLRGDLDAITLCALEKEPARRYASVADFASDIQHHLAGEVVGVRARNSFHRLFRGPFHDRRVQITGAILAATVLCVGTLYWSPSLRALFGWRTLRNDLPATQTVTSPVPKRSIAVLPFESFNTPEQNDYFVDGVQDNILTDLAAVADLRVIGRTSVASFRGTTKTPNEIGRSLGVSHLLEGSIQKSAGRVRVNVRLIETKTETEIWAEHYDRSIDDLFALQSELALTIVSRLKGTLSPDEKAAIEKRPTSDMLAYDLYLRAREEFYQYNHDPAIEFLDNAVARDPKFAVAYAFLAEMHLYSYRFSAVQDSAHLKAAKVAVEKALALAPNLADSHLAQAQYYYYGIRDFEAANRELTLAVALVNNSQFADLTALVQRRLGHWKDSIRNGERAAELDPRNPFIINELLESYISVRKFQDAEELTSRTIHLLPPTNNSRWLLRAESFLGRGRLEDARTAAAEAPLARPAKVDALVRLDLFARDHARAAGDLATMPESGLDTPSMALMAGQVAQAQGDKEKARASFQVARDGILKNLSHQPDDPSSLTDLSLADLGLGRKEEALREALRAVELVPTSRDAIDGVIFSNNLAAVYLGVGQPDAALELLAKLVKLPCGPHYGSLRFDPAWDELRTNPKFQDILAESTRPPSYE